MRNTFNLKIFLCAALLVLMALNSTGYARAFFGRTIRLPLQTIAPGQGKILIDFKLPANHEFATEAPSTVFVRTKDPQVLHTRQSQPEPLNLKALPYSLTYTAQPGTTVIAADLRVHFCDEKSKICLSDFMRVKFPVQVKDGASDSLPLKIKLKSKQTV